MSEHCRASGCDGMSWFWILILFIGTCNGIDNNSVQLKEMKELIQKQKTCICQPLGVKDKEINGD